MPVTADLRFGETTMAKPDIEGIEQPWIFNWQLDGSESNFFRQDVSFPNDFEAASLWQRIWGQRFAWELREAENKP